MNNIRKIRIVIGEIILKCLLFNMYVRTVTKINLLVINVIENNIRSTGLLTFILIYAKGKNPNNCELHAVLPDAK